MTDPRQAVAEGNAHLDEGRYQQAIETFDAAPDDPEAIQAKANVLMVLGRTDEAIGCFDHLIELIPNDPAPIIAKAAFVTSLGRYGQAAELYDQAVQLAPDNAAIHRDRALALQLQGEYDLWLASYDRSLDIDDGEADSWSGKAEVLIALGRFADSIACLEKAAALAGGNVESFGWTKSGYSLMDAEAYDEALHCYDRAIQQEPDDGLAYVGKASALEATGDVNAALGCYDRAIELRPQDAEVWFRKGNALLNDGQAKNALTSYDAALELDSNESLFWANKGLCLNELGEFKLAVEAYDKALQIDPQDAYAWDGKGSCLSELGRSREAIKALERALELEPELWTANNNLGFVLFRRFNENERALTYFEKAIELSDREALPIANKSETLAAMGRDEDARNLLEEALNQVDNKSDILHVLAYLHADYLNDNQKALGYYEQAEEFEPGNETRILNIAELLIKLNRFDESRDQISRVAEKELASEDRCVVGFLRFASYALEGRLDEARNCFGQFIDCVSVAGEQNGSRPPVNNWNYAAFVREIVQYSIDMETKFILLVAIDLQLGKLAAPSLKELTPSLPLATTSQLGTESDDEPQPTSLGGSILGWLRNLVKD